MKWRHRESADEKEKGCKGGDGGAGGEEKQGLSGRGLGVIFSHTYWSQLVSHKLNSPLEDTPCMCECVENGMRDKHAQT